MTESTGQPTQPNRRRRLAPVAASAAVVLALSAAGMAVAPTGGASLPSRAESASPTPPTEAAGPLTAMADLLTAAPADATTGRYHYTQIEQWSRGDDQIIGFLIETWRTDDGATTKSEKRVPGQPARYFDMAQIGMRQVFDAIAPASSSLGAGEVESFVERHGPPSGNPVVLASAISSDNGGPLLATECPPACDVTLRPIVFFDAITSLYRETYLDRAARAELLRLVAVQPGVAFLGEVTDRGGRKAVGVAVTEGGVRFCLLFDRDTGVLLASERGVPGHVLDDYSLYLTFDRRND